MRSRGWYSLFLLLILLPLAGCQQLVIDTEKLVKPSVELSEVVGFLAGLRYLGSSFISVTKRRTTDAHGCRGS